MKFGFYPQSIVDTDGMPLVGRVTLFVHDTDTTLDVFTIEGENYVQAANPQLLNAKGRLNSALFFEAAVIDVRIDKYIGAEGQMSVSSPSSDFRPFAFYEYGFDPSDIVSVEFVDTIAELMNSPTTSKYITVMGYYGAGDCMPRTYYWDAEAEDGLVGLLQAERHRLGEARLLARAYVPIEEGRGGGLDALLAEVFLAGLVRAEDEVLLAVAVPIHEFEVPASPETVLAAESNF